jgi:hypothetical protein
LLELGEEAGERVPLARGESADQALHVNGGARATR